MVDLEFSERMDTLLPSGHVGNQVHHTVTVSILVVIPEKKQGKGHKNCPENLSIFFSLLPMKKYWVVLVFV